MEGPMEKIPEVETAKALMTEAVAWSVMKWLRQKKTVRKAADRANAALDGLNGQVKDCWPADIRAAYEGLAQQGTRTVKTPCHNESISAAINAQAISSARKAKAADEEAYRARMDAENTFDGAEKQLSTALAREGCRKAIHSWELHEKAIRIAEALIA
jgi:hypothetical protein